MFQWILRFPCYFGTLGVGSKCPCRITSHRQAQETEETLANPGIGWETFHHTSNRDHEQRAIEWSAMGWANGQGQTINITSRGTPGGGVCT